MLLAADLSIVLDLDACKRVRLGYGTLCVSPDKATLDARRSRDVGSWKCSRDMLRDATNARRLLYENTDK